MSVFRFKKNRFIKGKKNSFIKGKKNSFIKGKKNSFFLIIFPKELSFACNFLNFIYDEVNISELSIPYSYFDTHLNYFDRKKFWLTTDFFNKKA